MSKKIILIILLIFLALFLPAESIQYEVDNYLISEVKYKMDNKNYTAYRYYKTKQQLQSENFDSIFIMIATPSIQAMGSFAGHAFIVLSRGDDLTNSIAITFTGAHEILNKFEQAIYTPTIGIPGYIDIKPFSQIAEKYTIDQDRTLFYYKINSNNENVNLLINRLYELTEENLTFQFFTKNCAFFTIQLCEAALDRDFSKETPVFIIPSYLPIIFEKNNLILENGSFSPPIARLKNESLNISIETIIEKKKFYKETQNETSIMDSFEKFRPQKDLYDYGTNPDSYMSQSSFGIKNNNPTFGLSFFVTNRYKQRQSPTQALQISLFEIELLYDEKVMFDSFKLIEVSYYPKINYGFNFTKKFTIMGERDLNNQFQPLIRGGLGLSLGNSNVLFDLTNDVDIPLSHLGINLSLNSEFLLYNEDGYILLEFNLPYYQANLEKEISLKSKAGITLFDRLDIEGGYNWLNQNYEASIIWNFNPFYY
jgi:hypothetical protein